MKVFSPLGSKNPRPSGAGFFNKAHKKRKVYLNNRLVPEERGLISVYDRGFLYGDGVFETLRAYRGKIFKAPEHIDRFFESAKGIALHLPQAPEELYRILYRTLRANQLQEARIRITATRGVTDIGLDTGQALSPTLVVLARKFIDYPKKWYREGISITVVKTRKIPASSLNPKIKSLNYLSHILAKIEAKAVGAEEGILLNQEGDLCEGTVSNLFWIRNQVLFTPASSSGILDGITRQTVLELARKLEIPVKEGAYPPEAILTADECFLTNTTMEILPVTRILGNVGGGKGQWIGKGRVGPLTRLLHRAYKSLVDQYPG